jgi:hypothetical protein
MMVEFIKDSSKTISSMGKVYLIGQMVVDTKETGQMASRMGLAGTFSVMEKSVKVNGRTEREYYGYEQLLSNESTL